jgi:hypothetical protein
LLRTSASRRIRSANCEFSMATAAEAVRDARIVHVQHAEHAVLAADQRRADGRADLLHQDRFSPEAVVLAGVVGEQRDLLEHRLSRDGLRHRPGSVAPTLVTRDLGDELQVRVAQ